MAGNEQKTEQATPRRLEKSRAEGNFPVSPEILAALYLAAALALWTTQGTRVWHELRLQTRQGILSAFRTDLNPMEAVRFALTPNLSLVGALALGAMALAFTALGVQLLQTGFRFAPSKLAPDITRLNPFPRLKQLPAQNRHQLIRVLILLPMVVWLAQSLIARHWLEILALPAMSQSEAIGKLFDLVRSVLWRATAVLVVVALTDVIQRRRKYAEDLRMSRQDIRDENKEAEGNQQAKQQIRRMMRDFTRRRMMSQVPTATAVIVNPTHYAVAIYYIAGESTAPKVVAKGKNFLAARIRAAAEKHAVPIVENPPLARSLYRSVEVGQEIPAALYRAVAEVLAYVYRMTNGRFRRG